MDQRINQVCNSNNLNYSCTFSDHPFDHTNPAHNSAFPQNVLSSYLQNTVLGKAPWTIKKWINRSLPSRSLHLSRVYNLMYVNNITHPKKNSYCSPTVCQIISWTRQVSALRSWFVLPLFTWKSVYFLHKVKNLIQKKILLSMRIKLDWWSSSLFSMLDCL